MKDIKEIEGKCPRCGYIVFCFCEGREKERPTEEDKREGKDSGQALSERPTTTGRCNIPNIGDKCPPILCHDCEHYEFEKGADE